MAEEEDKDGWTEIEVSDQPDEDREELEIEAPISLKMCLLPLKLKRWFKMRKRAKKRMRRN